MTGARATAEERLERILYILPAAHRKGGVSLDELALALGVDRATVLDDIEQVAAREYYHPAGSVDAFTITVTGDRVSVWTGSEFDRPVRLNAREALALQLGVRVLAGECGEDERAEMLVLAERLERELSVPEMLTVHVRRMRDAESAEGVLSMMERTMPYAERPPQAAGEEEPEIPSYGKAALEPASVEYDRDAEHEVLITVGDDTLRGLFSEAIEQHRVCRLLYLKPASRAPETRQIAPQHLVYQDGRWYVLAHDLERDAPRIFRLDRVLDAAIEERTAPTLASAEQLDAIRAHAAAYIADDDVSVTVRYAPAIAPWIAERTDAEPDADGSIAVQHHVADTGWLVQHVLQYGGDAWIESPPALRDLVGDAAAAIGS